MLDRRTFLSSLGLAGVSWWAAPALAQSTPPMLTKAIPSSSQAIPVIGMGTWITFNVGDDPSAIRARHEVLAEFFRQGGGLVDSSPMYGSSQQVLGKILAQMGGAPQKLFSADKVWTGEEDEGLAQLIASRKKWGVSRFDLLQVHNLIAWRAHLPLLRTIKQEGRLGHVGVTTSHGRRHDEIAQILTSESLDVVQLTYNLLDREAESRLLPLAKERGVAVIANRPFRGGELPERLAKKRLPSWVEPQTGCTSWPQLVLKWIVSHPAITCAIPATTRTDHMRENMGAGRGELPDERTREKMREAIVAAL